MPEEPEVVEEQSVQEPASEPESPPPEEGQETGLSLEELEELEAMNT